MHVTICKPHCMHVTLAELQLLACKWLSPSLQIAHEQCLTNSALTSLVAPVSQEAMAGLLHVGLAGSDGGTHSTLAHVSPLVLAACACLAIAVGGLRTWNLFCSWCWWHPCLAATSAPFSPVVMTASMVSPLVMAAPLQKQTLSVNTFKRDSVW
ncbi:hypothetical protein GYH30_000670 [Glycine max]|nr:hypothetical protein GYH30_000670 [Glycine max]